MRTGRSLTVCSGGASFPACTEAVCLVHAGKEAPPCEQNDKLE